MRTPFHSPLYIVLAGLLAGCGGDPSDSTGGSTATSDSSEPATTSATADDSGSATDTPTSSVTTGTGDSGDTSTSDASDTSSTGPASDSGDSGETGETGDSSTGDGGLGAAAEAAMSALTEAVEGVLFLSESDYPWTVVGIADMAPVTEANVKDVIADVYVPREGEPTLAERTIEVRTLAQLFDPLTTPQDWWGDFEQMQGEQYMKIRAALEDNLTDLQVFRFGEAFGDDLMGAIDVYVLGRTADGDVVGMWTVSVET